MILVTGCKQNYINHFKSWLLKIRTISLHLLKLKICLPHDLACPLLCICPRETKHMPTKDKSKNGQSRLSHNCSKLTPNPMSWNGKTVPYPYSRVLHSNYNERTRVTCTNVHQPLSEGSQMPKHINVCVYLKFVKKARGSNGGRSQSSG